MPAMHDVHTSCCMYICIYVHIVNHTHINCSCGVLFTLCIGGPDVTLAVHAVRQATASLVDLTVGGNVGAECPADPLIRVHGRW